MTDLKIKVVYRDKNLDPTFIKTYPLRDYTDMLRMNLVHIISDVEDLVYRTTGKSKDEWDDDTWTRFQHIKHKLLDNAGSISRLPSDLIEGGEQ